MAAPTYSEFIAALDAAGFVLLSDGEEVAAKALWQRWFAPLPAGQTITLGAADTEVSFTECFGQPDPSLLPIDLDFPEMRSRPEWLTDIVQDALQHDRDHGLLPVGSLEQTR